MRLDTTALTFMTKEEMRVLTAVELGMRNHEFVPVHIIERISHLKRANTYKVIQLLLKNKLVNRDSQKYEGYRLTYLGYDYLALNIFLKRGSITKVIGKVGVGKESDIYKCQNTDGQMVILKFARLGRTSFRAIKNKRDYLQHRQQYNWLYLSRLASVKEFSFMEMLYKNGYPTPVPIDGNRHGIVMSLIDGYTICNIRELEGAQSKYEECMDLLIKFAQNGLIHSDYNEFNLMIDHTYKLFVIDFPQMISTHHLNADELFQRDVTGVELWFTKKYGVTPRERPVLSQIEVTKRLDIEIKASGFLNKELNKNLKELELLDNYNKIVREENLNQVDGEINSDNDEEMLERTYSDNENGEKADHEVDENGEELKEQEGEEKKLDEDVESGDEEDSNDDDDDEDEENSDDEDVEEDNKEKGEKLDKKKKKEKEPKVKKTDKEKEGTEEFIGKALKKKFKPRKIVKKNTNKGKKKDANSEYFF